MKMLSHKRLGYAPATAFADFQPRRPPTPIISSLHPQAGSPSAAHGTDTMEFALVVVLVDDFDTEAYEPSILGVGGKGCRRPAHPQELSKHRIDPGATPVVHDA